MLRNYRDLVVWQKAYALCVRVYGATRKFSDDEWYGLSAQTRRSAVSVVSNIAEGYERHQTNEYIQFLRIAKGSLAEFETQLMLSRDLGYAAGDELPKLLECVQEIERMLKALIRSLRSKRA